MSKDNKHTPGTDPQPDKGNDSQHGHKIHTGKPAKSHASVTDKHDEE